MSTVRTEGLSVTLDGQRIVESVSLDVPSGQWYTIIGPNGAGKSTVLRAIAGLLRHSGTVEVDGKPVRGLKSRDRARLLAYLPQVPVLPSGMTVADYVLLGRTPHLAYLAREGKRDIAIVSGVLDRLALTPFAGRELSSLSGGERQRAMLARALAQQAAILLLDEPTTALDIGHQQQVLELIDRLRIDDELTVISTLHDLTLAGQYADELVLLVGGRAVATGKPSEVLTEANISTHYDATVTVTADADGRPVVHTARPRRALPAKWPEGK